MAGSFCAVTVAGDSQTCCPLPLLPAWREARRLEPSPAEAARGPRPPQRRLEVVLVPADRERPSLTADVLAALYPGSRPQDVVRVVVSGMGLVPDSAQQPFGMYQNVRELEADDNSLNLEAVKGLPLLHSLNLCANGIRGLNVCSEYAEWFPLLERLDLSFNQLRPSDLLALSGLPALVELCLCDNQLRALPEDLALPSLRTLLLDRNLLHEAEDVHILSRLPELCKLSLSHNRIATLPCLLFDQSEEEDVAGKKRARMPYGRRHRRNPRRRARSEAVDQQLSSALTVLPLIPGLTTTRHLSHSSPIAAGWSRARRAGIAIQQVEHVPFPCLCELEMRGCPLRIVQDVIGVLAWPKMALLDIRDTTLERGVRGGTIPQLAAAGVQVVVNVPKVKPFRKAVIRFHLPAAMLTEVPWRPPAILCSRAVVKSPGMDADESAAGSNPPPTAASSYALGLDDQNGRIYQTELEESVYQHGRPSSPETLQLTKFTTSLPLRGPVPCPCPAIDLGLELPALPAGTDGSFRLFCQPRDLRRANPRAGLTRRITQSRTTSRTSSTLRKEIALPSLRPRWR